MKYEVFIVIPEAGLEPARLAAPHFECGVSAIPPLRQIIGGGNRNRTGGKGFADLCLTAWLCRQYLLERKTGFEPATPTLARLYSTTELLPLMAGLAGFEPTHDGVKVRCLTAWL